MDNCNPTCQNEEVKAVPRSIEEVEQLANSAIEMMVQIEQRLEPILRIQPESTGDKEGCEPSLCPMQGRINNGARSISLVIAKGGSLLARLEI